MLTDTREDYLEAVLKLSQEMGEVRVTDLAAALGCRLPTVTRTVRAMAADGWLLHESRKAVKLSRHGRLAAQELAVRHELTVRFLTLVLGLAPEAAQLEAQRMKHGLTPEVCVRLAAWLSHLENLDSAARQSVLEYVIDAEDLAQAQRSVSESRHRERG